MVSTKVSNVGEEPGGYELEVRLDGEAVDSKTLNLDGRSLYTSYSRCRR
jgi:hypothetical protein